MNWKAGLAILVLVSAAFGAGALVTHNLAIQAAKASADSAAKVNRVRDSVAFVTREKLRESDSLGTQLGAQLQVMTVSKNAGLRAVDSAKAASDKARSALSIATGVVDSFRLYRDSLVPALEAENEALTKQLAVTDSLVLLNAAGWSNEIRKSAQLSTLLTSDSLALHADSLALDRASKASVVAVAPLSKISRAAETAAIGAATTGACAHKILSIGCLAGTVVVVKRAFSH